MNEIRRAQNFDMGLHVLRTRGFVRMSSFRVFGPEPPLIGSSGRPLGAARVTVTRRVPVGARPFGFCSSRPDRWRDPRLIGLCHQRRRPASSERLNRAAPSLPVTVQRSARIFSFVPGVYQRQSIVVDLGTVVPRGRYLKSIFLICRRCAPPVTPARLTSFALQRTHGCETVRLRGNEGSRRAQHRTFMFAGPWDARE